MKGFSFKNILACVKKKKSIFIALGIAVVVAIGLIIASSIMGSSSVTLKNEAIKLDENTTIEAGTVSGGGRHRSGSTITIKAEPKKGYEFVAWLNSDEEKTLASTDAEYKLIVPEKNLTLIATWEPVVYTIDLVLDSDTNTTEYPNTTYVVTDDDIFLNEPTKAGYTFLGWYEDKTDEAGKVQRVKALDYIETADAKNVTLYAMWAKSYAIQYDLNPTGNPRAAKAANPNNPTTFTEKAAVTLEAPICYEYDESGVATGGKYEFDHWERNGEAVTEISVASLTEEEKTNGVQLVAIWKNLDTPIYWAIS